MSKNAIFETPSYSELIMSLMKGVEVYALVTNFL